MIMCFGIHTYAPHKGARPFKGIHKEKTVKYASLDVHIYGLNFCLHFRSKVDHKVELD